jgi:sulfur transfer protein SufE
MVGHVPERKNHTAVTARERQDRFISDMSEFDNWADRFDCLASESESLPAACPEGMKRYRIAGCQSNTCFHAYAVEGEVFVYGWSNSAIMGGIIIAMMKMFNLSDVEDLRDTEVDFHTKTGLIDNLTPMRRDGLEEMVRRMAVLCPCKSTG